MKYYFKISIIISLLFCPSLSWSETVTPYEYLAQQERPVFKQGHTLPPLTRWGWTLDYDTNVEFARYWGYTLHFGVANSANSAALSDPNSNFSKMCDLVYNEPSTYSLSVLTNHYGFPSLPDETWCHDAEDNLLLRSGSPIWSPIAPNSVFESIGDYRSDPIAAIRTICKISMILDGGEYGLGVPGWDESYWAQDPDVVAAKGVSTWVDVSNEQFTRQQGIITDAARVAAPDRDHLVYFTDGGNSTLGTTVESNWYRWDRNYFYTRGISSDIQSSAYYYHSYDGWVASVDILSRALNAVSKEVSYGDRLSYNWFCGGFLDDPGEIDRYCGFLKCMYTVGNIGGIAGYFNRPYGSFFTESFDLENPPHWIQQMVAIARVHAEFSYLEDIIRGGDVLPGPELHKWRNDGFAYELPTGYTNTRVVARKLRDKKRWIITAWAADGITRTVNIHILSLGRVDVSACSSGNVYDARVVDGVASVTLLDGVDNTQAPLDIPTSTPDDMIDGVYAPVPTIPDVVIVSGDATPDRTGIYNLFGTYGGQPVYKSALQYSDGQYYYIWWSAGGNVFTFTQVVGNWGPYSWDGTRHVEGAYLGHHSAVGELIVTAYFELVASTPDDHGSITIDPEEYQYEYNSEVSLLAVPDEGYHFTSWSGDETSSDNPLLVTMTSNKSIEAHFELNTYGLLADAGTGAIAVDPVLVSYPHGTTVTLSATPPAGYHFTEWTGDSNAVTASITITMDTSKTLSANYAINEYPLNISAENGAVNAIPVLAVYEHDTTVTLTATPIEGYDFTGWNGSLVSRMNPLTITMGSTQTLQAYFMHATHTLTLVSEFGNVNASPEQSAYEYGSIISLEAVPINGYHFVGWEGDVTTSTNPLLVTIRNDINLTASFAPNLYPLLLESANGTVTVSPDQETYAYGTTVSLLAESNEHFLFGNWSGDVLAEVATQNPLIVTIDSTKTLEAHYTLSTYILMVSTEGEGMVHRLPEQESYLAGSTVTLTASPDTGWTFIGWSSDANETSNPVVISLTTETETGRYFPSSTGSAIPTLNPLMLVMLSTSTIEALFDINTYGVTVASENGQAILSPNQSAFAHGMTVTVTAVPEEGYHFLNWSGASTSTLNPLVLTADTTKTLIAHFAINEYPISVDAVNGSASIAPQQAAYSHGSTATLTATPDEGYHFIGWSGSVSSAQNPWTATVNSTLTLLANFATQSYELSVSGENGSVAAIPEFIAYTPESTVKLTATPAEGYHFTGWSDLSLGKQNPVTLTISSTTTLEALFAINTYELDLRAENGSITAAPEQDRYEHNTTVTLLATPQENYHFTGWSGDTTSTLNPLVASIDSTKTITGNFTIDNYTLLVDHSGEGIVIVAPDSRSFDHGSTFSVTALPDSAYWFAGWSGDISSGTELESSIVLTVTTNTTLTAAFVKKSFELNIAALGAGVVTQSPNQETYLIGSTVTLQAEAEDNHHFVSWTDTDTTAVYTENPLVLLVTAPTTLSATFEPDAFPLIVTSDHSGTVTLSSVLDLYDYGTTVSLLARPAEGFYFTGWSGDTTSTLNPTTITMLSTQSVAANFERTTHSLSTVAANGTVNVLPDADVFTYGTTVTLSASADHGYYFARWSGDISAELARLSNMDIVMDGDKKIEAVFNPSTITLTVSVDGPGNIETAPSQPYVYGTTVSLTAMPVGNAVFTGWSGDVNVGTAGDNPLVLSLDADKEITANFTPVCTLQLKVAGNGAVDVAPFTTYTLGSEVTINAKPNDPAMTVFEGWTRDVEAGDITDNPLVITMDGNKSLTANFVNLGPWTLDVSALNGTCEVSEVLPEYQHMTVIELTATPDEHYQFAGWVGDVPAGRNMANSFSVTMDSNKTIAPNFILEKHVVSLDATENGSIEITPKADNYAYESIITLTATPNAGFVFSGGTGDIDYVSKRMLPLTLTVLKDMQMGAEFVREPVRHVYRVTAQKCLLGGGLESGLVFEGATSESSVKITLSKKGLPSGVVLVDGMAADPKKSSITWIETSMLKNIEVRGDMNKFYTICPVGNLKVTGALKSLTTKDAYINEIIAGGLGAVKIAANVDSSGAEPVVACTNIYAGTLYPKTSKVTVSGAILRDLYAEGITFSKVSVATKAYTNKNSKSKYIAYGAVNGGYVSAAAINLLSVKGGSISPISIDLVSLANTMKISGAAQAFSVGEKGAFVKRYEKSDISGLIQIAAQKTKIITKGGDILTPLIHVTGEITKLAASTKYGLGGQIGDSDPTTLFVVSGTNAALLNRGIKSVIASQGISGRFMAGAILESGDSGPEFLPTYDAAMKIMATREGIIQGESWVSNPIIYKGNVAGFVEHTDITNRIVAPTEIYIRDGE